MLDIYKGQDPRTVPTFSLRDAAHYLRLPVATLRSWLAGREYPTAAGAAVSRPLILPGSRHPLMLSFLNLVEAHVLAAIRRTHGVQMNKVRSALDYVEQRLTVDHPLARQAFRTDGIDLFVDHMGLLITASRGGQLAVRQFLEAHLRRVELDEAGLARRFFPFTRRGDLAGPMVIVIDPSVFFGRPVVVGTGIPTDVLAERYFAGETMDELAKDYGCDRLLIEEAIRCEAELRRAA
ncbi:MAG: DUF433 domain-containing protein [Deltaproteobacteria bacterium]|nr:DUF433 domain-containing protein [Deltaproteobacteria bacterium]